MSVRFPLLVLLLVTVTSLGPAQAPKTAPTPVIQELPGKAAAWLEGYRVRWPLRVVGDAAKQKSATVVASLPTGGWLKPGASDLAVQSADGQTLPVQVLSHDPAGDTLIQFKRNGNDPWYWAYGMCDKPLAQAKIDPASREGLTVELRDWAGDDLDSWAKVRDGLKKSENVIGNALVAEVQQNCNPARPDRPTKFAASYRGFLDLKKDGVYRFYVNADDAAFLFIDGFKVFELPGANQAHYQLKQKVLDERSGKIELKAGVHPFEVHHVVGNNARSQGLCALLWQPEDQKLFTFVPRTAFMQPLVAQPGIVEVAQGTQAASFVSGMDDALSAGAVKLYLVRFEAQGSVKDGEKLTWDFGDGTTGTGRSVLHVYLKEGDYAVTLRAGQGAPVFKRLVNVWAAPVLSSPFSLSLAVKSLGASDWKKWDVERVRQMFAFLLICEQPERWPLVDAVAQHLLAQEGLELEDRIRLTTARMEALAQLRRAKEALQLAEQAEKQVAKVPSLLLGVRLATAAIHQYQLKDSTTASKMYKAMLDDYKRVEHPNLRLAAIRWGDLHAEAGDLTRAGEAYRLANTLGGERFAKTAQVDAVTRGAKLRIATQKLRDGDVRATRRLLEEIEIDFPEQKLEGLYRFLRAEADRIGGHYEEAVRNYEVLVRLPQWAGYRDRAWFGIADSYHRMGRLEKSLEWLATIKQASPAFYEKQKLADQQRLIEARLARIKAAKEKGEVFFAGFTTGFEPGDALGETKTLKVVPGLGMQGPHVALFDPMASPASFDVNWLAPNLNANANYWVEFWYRETLAGYNHGNQQQAYVWISGDGLPNPEQPRNHPIYLERSYGQWRKLGYKIQAPLAQDGRLRVAILNFAGVMEIDGLTVRPVSDQRNDSLISFLEGTETP